MTGIAENYAAPFERAWTELVRPADTDAASLRVARDVVLESVALYEEKCSFAPSLQGVFADHYSDHVLNLASQFVDVFDRLRIGDDSPLRDPRCLVIVFCAFAWHDAGMAEIPAESEETDTETIIRQVHARRNHDTRSLDILDRIDIGRDLSRWKVFWDRYADENWPRPIEVYARDLLARVCQSHGDDPTEWLTPESLVTYRRAAT